MSPKPIDCNWLAVEYIYLSVFIVWRSARSRQFERVSHVMRNPSLIHHFYLSITFRTVIIHSSSGNLLKKEQVLTQFTVDVHELQDQARVLPFNPHFLVITEGISCSPDDDSPPSSRRRRRFVP